MISLKLALRTLKRFRLYTVINAASLILSLVCVLSLSRYIYREYTINSDLPGHERVFFTIFDQFVSSKDRSMKSTLTFYNPRSYEPEWGLSKSTDFNERCTYKTLVSGGKITDKIQLEEGKERLDPLSVLYTDSTFFKMLTYNILYGSPSLKGENDALIMSDVAERIFGTTNVVGRSWLSDNNTKRTVIGVIKRPHCKTTFDFDVVYNIHGTGDITNPRGLVQLSQAKDSVFINNKLNEEFAKSLKSTKQKGNYFSLREHLLSLKTFNTIYSDTKRIHLYQVMLAIFLIIGVFNYLNLHSVIMQRRKRDIQIKTIFGARRKNIFRELFMEHFLILSGTLPFIWLLIYLSRDLLNEHFGIPLESDIRFDIGFSIALPLLLGLLFSIVSFVQIRKQATDTSSTSVVPAARRSSYARIAFLFVQYVITFSLLVFALYLNHNIYYLFQSDRGYRAENILQFNITTGLPQYVWVSDTKQNPTPHHDRLEEIVPVFKRSITNSPLFDGVTLGERPYDRFADNEFVLENGKVIKASSHHATKEWMEFFQLRFIHGRNWNDTEQTQVKGGINDDIPLTADKTYKIIVNESLWKQLSPAEQNAPFMMHKTMDFGLGNANIRVQIIGVFKDFHLWKLSDKVEPLIFYLEGQWGYTGKTVFTAVKPGKEKEAIAYLKNLYERLCPGEDFSYKWMNDDLMDRHAEDFHAMTSVSVFAIFAILISCLGLFGISLYDIRGRYREIALRKINGAHNKDIYRILFRKYVFALLGAAFLASPFAYYGVTVYIDKVENHAPLTIWIFIGALLILALVSILTLMLQIRRAVHLNPAEVMKTE